MGGKQSKQSFSRFDDLVVDHNDVWAKLKEVFFTLGSKGSSCTLPLTESFSVPRHPKDPSDSSSSESVAIVVHCDGSASSPTAAAAAAATTAAAVTATSAITPLPPCCSDDSTVAAGLARTELAAAVAEAAAAVANTAAAGECTHEAAAEAEVPPAAAAAAAALPAAAGVRVRPAIVPPLPELTKLSISSNANTARGEVEKVFTCVDWQQQEQDKAEALSTLAASAGSSEHELLSEAEKRALRENGRQARLAAEAELAAKVDESDAALKVMSQEGRERWFEEHAQQLVTDAAEACFDDEWASLPPEVMAMVAELQARG